VEELTRLQLPAVLASLPKFLAFTVERARRSGFDSQRIRQVELVLEEVLVNIMEYAYPGESGMVTLQVENRKPERLVFEIRDRGKPFNPLQRKDPDVESPLSTRPVGGLGVFLIKELADELFWKRQENENCLTIIFSGGQHDQ